MKRSICLIFAVLMLMSQLIMPISAIAEEEEACCSKFNGTTTYVLEHPDRGGAGGGYGCYTKLQTRCSYCGTIFDTWWATSIPCPHRDYWY